MKIKRMLIMFGLIGLSGFSSYAMAQNYAFRSPISGVKESSSTSDVDESEDKTECVKDDYKGDYIIFSASTPDGEEPLRNLLEYNNIPYSNPAQAVLVHKNNYENPLVPNDKYKRGDLYRKHVLDGTSILLSHYYLYLCDEKDIEEFEKNRPPVN